MPNGATDASKRPGGRRPSAQAAIDVHFHLFTINTVLLYALVALWDLIVRIIEGNELPASEICDSSKEVPDLSRSSCICRLLKMIWAWSHLNISSLYHYLRCKCPCSYDYTVVPLMVDFAYCTDTHVLGILLKKIDESMRPLSHLARAIGNAGGAEMLAALENISKLAHETVSGTIEPFWPVGFWGHAEQLASLAADHPHRVFPFLAVDPRRPDILTYVKERVGPDGPFYGIKLYAPTGFSPTDPVLFGNCPGDDCLYKFCEERQIPITAHCATVGLAYLGNEVRIHGHIMPFDEDKPATASDSPFDVEPTWVNRTIKFTKCLPHCTLEELVEERSQILNDPRIWALVLKRYNNLYLNLAHFGLGAEILVRDREPERKTPCHAWTYMIARLMEKYPNLYTDLAGFANYEELRRFKTHVYDALPLAVRQKVMYGSDWDVLLYYEDSLSTYVDEFKKVFTQAVFDDMSNRMPREFLFERP